VVAWRATTARRRERFIRRTKTFVAPVRYRCGSVAGRGWELPRSACAGWDHRLHEPRLPSRRPARGRGAGRRTWCGHARTESTGSPPSRPRTLGRYPKPELGTRWVQRVVRLGVAQPNAALWVAGRLSASKTGRPCAAPGYRGGAFGVRPQWTTPFSFWTGRAVATRESSNSVGPPPGMCGARRRGAGLATTGRSL